MAGMKSMRRTKAEREAQTKGDAYPVGPKSSPMPPEKDDIELRLEHHHIKNLGLDGPLPHGTRVSFHGEGEVGDSGTHEGYADAEPRHHMTIRLERAGMDHDEGELDKRKDDIRTELKKNTDASEAKAANRDAARVNRAKGGEKVAEKVSG